MQKLLLCVVWALFAGLVAHAVPAKRTPRIVTQPDGTSLTVILSGDEAFHWYHTADGIPLTLNANGAFCYARFDTDRLVPTTQLAHDASLRTNDEALFVKQVAAKPEQASRLASKRTAMRNKQRAERIAQKGPQRVGESVGAIGKYKGLMILVNFQDVKMKEGNTREVFDDMMNLKGYTGNGNASSVHDYFYAQSYGKFDVSFDVVGPVTVSRKMVYYGKNDYWGNDSNPFEMVKEACELVDDQVNFADYDWDNDGEVDQVYIVYAGYSEASGAPASTIWPHEFTLSAGGIHLNLDGVKIDTYGCSSELTGITGSKMDGIGTPCHEYSHCLGLPDMYDTGGGNNFGLDTWSIMDYGCYAGNGYGPVGYTSYERMFSGWMEPVELKEPAYIWMKPLTEVDQAYIVYNEANRNEFYMLENRQKVNSDQEIPGHGMLVIHVDYNKYVWESNSVNYDANHQRCTLIAADNSYLGSDYWSANTLSGDPFPGTSHNTQLTDTSSPAAFLYNPNTNGSKRMGKPITEIEEHADGSVSFSFMGGENNGIENATTNGNTLSPATQVDIYSADGSLVGKSTYGAFKRSNLPAGIYLLRSAHGTTKVAL